MVISIFSCSNSSSCNRSTIITLIFILLTWTCSIDKRQDLFASSACIGKFNSTEFNALHTIYNAMNGPEWVVKIGKPWNFTIPTVNPCNVPWAFLLCNTRCRVKTIRFNNVAGMIGNIPDVFNAFPYMEELNIAQNPRVGGPIPTTISTLTRLLSLDLSNNLFSGSLPPSFVNLQRLKRLDLSSIGLTGSLPENIWLLPSMEIFQISDNSFSGTIPSSIGEIVKNLTIFDISGNALIRGTIPHSMGQLKRLVEFNVGSNRLTGTIPDVVGYWTNLTIFSTAQNIFVGTIPDCIANWTNLESFVIGDNRHTGSLPNIDYSRFRKIIGFDCDKNRFIGKLPPLFFTMTSLNKLVMSRNQFSGSLDATTFLNMKKLTFLDVGTNNFTGTLPPMEFPDLVGLTIKINKFEKSIPSSLSDVSLKLREFYADFNRLTGTIPESMWYLQSLQLLNVAYNRLTGTIPNFINVTMPSLSVVEISTNKFHGPFPVSALTLPSLTTLDIHDNVFTGTIPDPIGYMVHSLLYADFSLNLFSGTIPESVTLISSMAIFSVGHNEMTGTIAPLISMTSLSYGFFYNNWFTGTIPAPFFFLKSFLGFNNLLTGVIPLETGGNLRVFNIDNNFIHGTIPIDEDWWQRITVLSTANNLLTGTLSTNVSSGRTLQFFDVSSNTLTGTISKHFINHVVLNKLYLQNNEFVGNIEEILNPDVHHFLSSFDISNNAFTGTIPSKLFYLRRLSEFAAVKNCMTGSIPSSVCVSNRTLSSLAIDGLFTSDKCTHKLFRHIPSLDSYLLRHPLQGTIPSCLFEDFIVLTTLHAAGNGLEGDFLGKLTKVSQKLVDLSLSHNKLTGTIPHVVQQHAWQTLDLSFNKFGGELDESIFNFQPTSSATSSTTSAILVDTNDANVNEMDYTDDHNSAIFPQASTTGGSGGKTTSNSTTWPSLYLDINRLSGDIPSSLLNAHSINILSGNIFKCNIDKSELPSHDPNKGSYECGSNSVNIALYVWIVITSTLFFVAATVLGWFTYCCYRSNLSSDTMDEDTHEQSEHLFMRIRALVKSYWKVYDLLAHIDPALINVSNNPNDNNKEDFVPGLDSKQDSKMIEDAIKNQSIDAANAKGAIQEIQDLEQANVLSFQVVGLLLPTARRWALYITCILLFFGMIVYPLLKTHYSRYTYSYAWVLGANFLTGAVPTVVVMSLLIVLAFAIYSELDMSLLLLCCSPSPSSALTKALHNRVNVRCFLPEVMKLSMIQDNRNREFPSMSTVTATSAQITQEDPKTIFSSVSTDLKTPSLTSERILPEESTSVSLISSSAGHDSEALRLETRSTAEVDESELTANRWKFKITWYLVVGLVVIFDAIIVLAVNMLYVKIISNSNVNARGKQLIAIATSIYKLLWNSFMFKIFKHVRNQAQLTHYFPLTSLTYQHEEEAFAKVLGSCMTALSLFNSIIAPCVAVAFVSSDCFLYVVSSAPSIEVTYQSQPCRALLLKEEIPQQLECRGDVESYSTSFVPPFMYAYQCSSQLLVTFVEVFVYRFIIGGMLVPCIQIGLKLIQGYVYHRYGERSFAWKLVNRLLMKALQPMYVAPTDNDIKDIKEEDVEEEKLTIKKKLINETSSSTQSIQEDPSPVPLNSIVRTESGILKETSNQKALDAGWFRAERNIIYIATDMAIMLTFGTMFPPLALVGCLAILVYTSFLQLILGRIYHLFQQNPTHFQFYINSIRDDWKGMTKWMINAFHTMRPLVLIFWSFFLFDTLGDSYGTTKAAWIFLIMGLIPFIIALVNVSVRRWKRYCEDRDRQRKMSILSHSIEMQGPDGVKSADLLVDGSLRSSSTRRSDNFTATGNPLGQHNQ